MGIFYFFIYSLCRTGIIKETYKISPIIFKKIVKSSMEQDNNIDDLIDEIQLIEDIGEIE